MVPLVWADNVPGGSWERQRVLERGPEGGYRGSERAER